MEACTLLEATESAQDFGWKRLAAERAGEGEVLGSVHTRPGKVSVRRACCFVFEGVLLGGVGAWLRRSCWRAFSPAPVYTPAGAQGEGMAPLLASRLLRREFPGLAGETGVGSCKGGWQPQDLILLCCGTLNRCLLFTEPHSVP